MLFGPWRRIRKVGSKWIKMQNKSFQKNNPSKREVEVDWESIFFMPLRVFFTVEP